MSIWRRIAAAAAALRAGEPLSAALARLRTPPERRVAFTIAVIALAAKMAKADGRVTRDEIRAFREVFAIAPADEPAAARVYDLAKQDVAGFDAYAAQVARLFGAGSAALYDLLDGLFHVAAADGQYHACEDVRLRRAAEIFGVSDGAFRGLLARYAPEADPWAVLGLDPGADAETVRARWRALVRETHPDVLIGHGLPEEAVKLGADRLRAVNDAYEAIIARG
jgi:DnaJ like chaperone protein